MVDKKLLVLVEKSERESLDSIAEALSSAGMVVENKLRTTGMIMGYAASESVQNLSKIPGVQTLREEGLMSAISDSGKLEAKFDTEAVAVENGSGSDEDSKLVDDRINENDELSTKFDKGMSAKPETSNDAEVDSDKAAFDDPMK